MKDLIKFCMTHHEAEIRQLSKTPLGSQRFDLFIKRYEINCEPPPPPSRERYSATLSSLRDDGTNDTPICLIRPIVDPRTWAGPSRGVLDAEEEDYFNADDNDDDDTNVISINPTWQKPNNTLLSSVPISGIKRKRKTGISVTGKPPSPRPPLRPAAGLGSLLDYDDDDDGDTPPLGDENKETSSSAPVDVSIPPTPLLAAASLPKQPPKRQEENDEDQGLESLVSVPRGQSPAPPSNHRLTLPMRLAEKRRRNDVDEEDGLMERLRKSKKVDIGPASKDGANPVPGNRSGKGGEQQPKTIKVKLGVTSLALSSPNQQQPEPANHTPLTSPDPPAKDGDTG